MITGDDFQTFSDLLFKHVDVSRLLKSIPGIEERLLYLNDLSSDNLISVDTHDQLKSDMLNEL